MSLSEVVNDDARRPAVVADGLALLDAELADTAGISGAAVRAGYAALGKLKPGMVEHALDRLLPRLAPAIDPHLAAGRETGDVGAHFVANGDTIAEDLLAITDARAEVTGHRAAAKAYAKLRSSAKSHVVSAMPRLAALADRHG